MDTIYHSSSNTAGLHKGMTKRALLENSSAGDVEEHILSFKVTKAKALHIQHTLNLVNQIRLTNKEQLKPELENIYTKYKVGKL